jgi:hypothetical protein
VKGAGRAVELRPAPKARKAAHPQEHQHSAAEGGTRDRVRPAGALHVRRSRGPASGIVARLGSRVTMPHRIYVTTCCMALPRRFHGQSLRDSATSKQPLKADCFQGLDLVAGVGFEPTTFRL